MEHRRALLRNLVTSLIVFERIETTLAKAKELRRVADRMVTLGKRGTLHARRQAASYVRTQAAVQKLFAELATRFAERPGGYTRVLKLGRRQGDGAPMAIIEYLGASLKPARAERKAGESAKVAAKEKVQAKPKKGRPAKPEKTRAKKAAAKEGAKGRQAAKQEVQSAPRQQEEKPKKKRGLGFVFRRRPKQGD